MGGGSVIDGQLDGVGDIGLKGVDRRGIRREAPPAIGIGDHQRAVRADQRGNPQSRDHAGDAVAQDRSGIDIPTDKETRDGLEGVGGRRVAQRDLGRTFEDGCVVGSVTGQRVGLRDQGSIAVAHRDHELIGHGLRQ